MEVISKAFAFISLLISLEREPSGAMKRTVAVEARQQTRQFPAGAVRSQLSLYTTGSTTTLVHVRNVEQSELILHQ